MSDTSSDEEDMIFTLALLSEAEDIFVDIIVCVKVISIDKILKMFIIKKFIVVDFQLSLCSQLQSTKR